jgi:hypothetical protein
LNSAVSFSILAVSLERHRRRFAAKRSSLDG